MQPQKKGKGTAQDDAGGGEGGRAAEGRGREGKVRLVENGPVSIEEKELSRGKGHTTVGEGGRGAVGRGGGGRGRVKGNGDAFRDTGE